MDEHRRKLLVNRSRRYLHPIKHPMRNQHDPKLPKHPSLFNPPRTKPSLRPHQPNKTQKSL
ncbi:hypothetical protein BC829DRAFT_397289, partial [Chytridium lagenaria]